MGHRPWRLPRLRGRGHHGCGHAGIWGGEFGRASRHHRAEFSGRAPAYGIGISGTLPWTSDVLPVQFVVNFRDIGVLFERPGGLYAAMDTGFITTGLRVPFTSYFNQTGEEIDDLTWQDIVDGNGGDLWRQHCVFDG